MVVFATAAKNAMSTINTIDLRHFRIPLDEVLEDAKHGAHTHVELVTATVRTADGKLSAQFEHTIMMTESGPEILTSTSDGPQKGHRFENPFA